jgi:hypothetical protein
MSVLTRMYSRLQANDLNWLIDLYTHSHTRHVRSDYKVLTAASQSPELVDWRIGLYYIRYTMHVRSDYIE